MGSWLRGDRGLEPTPKEYVMGNRSDVARDALVKAGARQLWAGAIPRVGSVAMYEANARTVILQTTVSKGVELGWELFVPAIYSNNKTDATIEAAVRWLHEGVLPGAGGGAS
jgi:hypothetical protein